MLSALANLAQSYTTYTYTTTTTEPSAGFWTAYYIVVLIIAVVVIAAMWKIFTKAGKPGWAAIIPIYNTIVLLQIIGKPWWWILLMLIPLVNIVILIMTYNELSKVFGRGVGTTLLLIFFPYIGFCILGFGKARYQKPATAW